MYIPFGGSKWAFRWFSVSNRNVHILSYGYSPTLEKTIGMALVKSDYSSIGTNLDIEIRGKRLKAIVVSMPFYRNFE